MRLIDLFVVEFATTVALPAHNRSPTRFATEGPDIRDHAIDLHLWILGMGKDQRAECRRCQ